MGVRLVPLTVPVTGVLDADVARALWTLAEARQRTVRAVADLPDAYLDWLPSAGGHAIGTLLYHIAATEMEWVCLDLLGARDFGPNVGPLLAPGTRDTQGRLVAICGETLATHLARLSATRAHTEAALGTMTTAELRRPRPMALEPRGVTPEWVVHHLAQHEAEHRGQIIRTRGDAEALARQAAR